MKKFGFIVSAVNIVRCDFILFLSQKGVSIFLVAYSLINSLSNSSQGVLIVVILQGSTILPLRIVK